MTKSNGGTRGRKSRKERMMSVLATLAEDIEAPAASRVRAAEIVLAYEDGKPTTKASLGSVSKAYSQMSNEDLAERLQNAAKATKGITEV